MGRYNKEADADFGTLGGVREALDSFLDKEFTVQSLMDRMMITYDSFSFLWALDYLEERGIIIFAGYGNMTQQNQYRKNY